MATVKKQAVVDNVYQLALNQAEMEALFVILADTASDRVWDSMCDYGFKVDGSVDTPFDLYQTVKDALDVDAFGRKEA